MQNIILERHSSIHPSIHSSIHPFIRSFVRSFIQSLFSQTDRKSENVNKRPNKVKKRYEGVFCSRPASGSLLLFSRQKVPFRKDGYFWKKRKDGKTTREDHMKLKVQGVECIYGSYVHSAILPTFHRRCYWLLQVITGSGVQFMVTFL